MRHWVLYIWTMTALELDGAYSRNGGNSKITGGRYVLRIEDFPYMVSMMVNGRHKCGGSLLNPSYVITACHCVATLMVRQPAQPNGNLADLRFVAGTVSLGDDGLERAQIRTPKMVIPHPQCRIARYDWIDHDIGLAEMTELFEINFTVKPINLFSFNATEYDEQVQAVVEQKHQPFCTLASYEAKSKQLMGIRTYPHPRRRCLEEYRIDTLSEFRNSTQVLCTSGEKGQGVNKRDMGAAWVCDGYMMGVFIYIKAGLPMVCQKFSAALDWLLDTNICGPDARCTVPTGPPCDDLCRDKRRVLNGARPGRGEYGLILLSILALSND